MTELRSRMIQDMQLHGLAARTQQSYVEDLLDRSIATEGYIIAEGSPPYGDKHWIDLQH